MSNRKKVYIAIPLIITLLILWNAFSQPGLNDFDTTFKEVDLYRNENNTGPVERIYLVTTNDSIWNEMERYSKLMPYSKLGTTKVYFFHQDHPFPTKALSGRVNFDERYNKYCLARYEKNSFGAESFSVFPF